MNQHTTAPLTTASAGVDPSLLRFAVEFTGIKATEHAGHGVDPTVDLAITVNGTTKRLVNDDFGLGLSRLRPRLEFHPQVPSDGAIAIAISGVLTSSTGADEPFLPIERTFTGADGFGAGAHSVKITNRHVTCTLAFEIRDETGPPPPSDGGDDDDDDDDGPGHGHPDTPVTQ